MALQIFGSKKSQDTKKAERFFKERGKSYQFVDLADKGISRGELTSVVRAAGPLSELLDPKTKEKEAYLLVQYLSEEDRFEKVLEHPLLLRQPIVRDGKKAFVGYRPDDWKEIIG
jgi:arsenate reductase-like glutaredoxin family protein